jgi:hypothetical protein
MQHGSWVGVYQHSIFRIQSVQTFACQRGKIRAIEHYRNRQTDQSGEFQVSLADFKKFFTTYK